MRLDRIRRRVLKEAGIVSGPRIPKSKNSDVKPRIVVHTARHGFMHPISRSNILQVLEVAGPEAIYGLKRVELCRAPDPGGSGLAPLGRLYPEGRIVLFEQPVPPWRIRGKLSEASLNTLKTAGAVVTEGISPFTAIIEWPGDTLRDFMLFDVFLHELGHHILQHNKGKRPARIARSRDHEAFAERFARNRRRTLSGSGDRAGMDKNRSKKIT